MAGLSLKRLESLSLRELAILLQNDSKNRHLSNVTITEVRITNDLSYMTIFYTCLIEKDKEACSEALEHSKGYIRKALAQRIKARKMPELIFKFDESLAYGNHIDELLNEYHKKHDKEGNE